MRNTESMHPVRRPEMGAASPRQKAEDDARFKADLLDLIPFLRAFARSLCGNQETADDLAQETLVKAWQARDMFAPGTNLKAWLFTILRNQFYSDSRRAWRQAPWDQEAAERIPGSAGEQSWAAELSDTARALSRGRWLFIRRCRPDLQLCRGNGQKQGCSGAQVSDVHSGGRGESAAGDASLGRRRRQ